MELNDLGGNARRLLQEILGYLNFSSGAADTRFLADLNELFGLVEGESEDGGDESERTGERTEEDAEEPSEPGRAEPKAEAAPSGSTGAVRAPEMPTGAEPPRPAQTRPQVG